MLVVEVVRNATAVVAAAEVTTAVAVVDELATVVAAVAAMPIAAAVAEQVTVPAVVELASDTATPFAAGAAEREQANYKTVVAAVAAAVAPALSGHSVSSASCVC